MARGTDVRSAADAPRAASTSAVTERDAYPPGAKGVLRVAFAPDGRIGTISREILLVTNDPTKPVRSVRIDERATRDAPALRPPP